MSDNNYSNIADEKLRKMGYEHPENMKNDTFVYSPYKVYTDQATASGGDGDDEKQVYVSKNSNIYATYDSNTEPQLQISTVCPVCENKAMYTCNCDKKEMLCRNGHFWYYEKNGKLVVGDPHKDE